MKGNYVATNREEFAMAKEILNYRFCRWHVRRLTRGEWLFRYETNILEDVKIRKDLFHEGFKLYHEHKNELRAI